MMNSLRLNDQYDLVIQTNEFVPISGREAITQHLAVRFGIFFAEFRYDTSVGVPYYQDILVKNPSFVVVQERLRQTILLTPGIIDLIDFFFDLVESERSASLRFRAQSTEGIIDFNQDVEL
jgi:hypothetical protein